MEFEKEFKYRISKEVIEQMDKNFQRKWDSFAQLEGYDIKDIIENILDSISAFISLYNRTIGNKDKKLHFNDQDITPEALMNLKKRIQLDQISQNEKHYIEYENELVFYGSRDVRPIVEVLVRKLLLEKMDIPDLKVFDKIIEEKTKDNERLARRCWYVKSLINGELFDVEDKFFKKISDRVEKTFNEYINCGGYALEVDTCIFSGKNDFEKNVSSILELFPFVRLIGDTVLGEDEYLVVYKCSKNGHHFIKRKEDGTFVEKTGSRLPRRFQGWSKVYEDLPEAVFAVKKEHEREYYDKYGYIEIPTESAKNFEESLNQAIQNRQNVFEYHNHNYSLKKSNEGIIYVCSNGKIVAQMLISDKDYNIEIEEGSKDYISNTKPGIPIDKKEEQDR